MLSLPFSLIGVVLALNLTGGSLNLMSLIGVIMLMGLVAKNAILLLDCAREEERQGIDREEALMHAGRVRLRPILMTTFALMAGMMPVAIGVGEGGEFYSPMAVAIIGGTDRVDDADAARRAELLRQHRDRARARGRSSSMRERRYGNPVVAFLLTFLEVLATLTFLRFFYRVVRYGLDHSTPAEHPVERAARLVAFAVPPGFIARPKAWQRGRRGSETDFGTPASPDAQGMPTPPAPKPRWKPIKAS